jgi:ElaB/YqjD/DUF883 family membrane-anchored ribosome-binding protein
MRLLVRKGQEEVQTKLDKILDEKIESMEENAENIKSKGTEEIKKAKKKVKKLAEANADK